MLFSAAAAGAAHPDALINLLHHPGTGISMLTAGDIPWQQVGGWVRPWGEGVTAPSPAWHLRHSRQLVPRTCAVLPHLNPTSPPRTRHRTPLAPLPQVLYCGLLTTDLTLLMEVFALQDVSSVDAAIIYTLEPVLGAGFAWMLLGERLGAKGLAGAGIILASSLASQVMGGSKAAPAEEGQAQEGDERKLLGDKAE